MSNSNTKKQITVQELLLKISLEQPQTCTQRYEPKWHSQMQNQSRNYYNVTPQQDRFRDGDYYVEKYENGNMMTSDRSPRRFQNVQGDVKDRGHQAEEYRRTSRSNSYSKSTKNNNNINPNNLYNQDNNNYNNQIQITSTYNKNASTPLQYTPTRKPLKLASSVYNECFIVVGVTKSSAHYTLKIIEHLEEVRKAQMEELSLILQSIKG